MSLETNNSVLSILLITLLKGVLYRDEQEKNWQCLMDLQNEVKQYMAMLGLELIVFEDEGFAWLKLLDSNEENPEISDLPKLITRRPLSYVLSLLLVVLRKKLLEFDVQSSETRLILTREEIIELMQPFIIKGDNEAKWHDQIAGQIKKAVEMGFLKRFKKSQQLQEVLPDTYEVRRIIGAFIDSQWLHEFEEKMAEYKAYVNSIEGKEL